MALYQEGECTFLNTPPGIKYNCYQNLGRWLMATAGGYASKD